MYARLCSWCVHAPVSMLCTCACIHVAVRDLSNLHGLGVHVVFLLCTCACVHVVYVRLCSCCVRALMFMLQLGICQPSYIPPLSLSSNKVALPSTYYTSSPPPLSLSLLKSPHANIYM